MAQTKLKKHSKKKIVIITFVIAAVLIGVAIFLIFNYGGGLVSVLENPINSSGASQSTSVDQTGSTSQSTDSTDGAGQLESGVKITK